MSVSLLTPHTFQDLLELDGEIFDRLARKAVVLDQHRTRLQIKLAGGKV